MKLNIGLSNMSLWLYLEGKEKPIRGWSDANGDLIDGQTEQISNGEMINYSKKINLSRVREVKIRSGWNGLTDVYGEIKIK